MFAHLHLHRPSRSTFHSFLIPHRHQKPVFLGNYVVVSFFIADATCHQSKTISQLLLANHCCCCCCVCCLSCFCFVFCLSHRDVATVWLFSLCCCFAFTFYMSRDWHLRTRTGTSNRHETNYDCWLQISQKGYLFLIFFVIFLPIIVNSVASYCATVDDTCFFFCCWPIQPRSSSSCHATRFVLGLCITELPSIW